MHPRTAQELTPRMRANLVSYGERMSTRIFAAHLRSRGVAARQHDAWRIGFTCTDDDFENGASHCVSLTVSPTETPSPSLPPLPNP
jgi:aspartokinase